MTDGDVNFAVEHDRQSPYGNEDTNGIDLLEALDSLRDDQLIS